MPSFVAKLMYMERRHEKDGVNKTVAVREPEVLYGQHAVRSNAKSSIRVPNWEDRTESYTIEELHQGIRQAEADVAAGRVTPANDCLEKMRKRYRL